MCKSEEIDSIGAVVYVALFRPVDVYWAGHNRVHDTTNDCQTRQPQQFIHGMHPGKE